MSNADRPGPSASEDQEADSLLAGEPAPEAPAGPAVRFVGETPDSWEFEGLAIPYGGPVGGMDLTGTFFSPTTDLCLDWFPDGGRPILYAHGFDPAIRAEVVGRQVGPVTEDERGRWVRLQIDKAKAYATEIRRLAEEGVLALSSGAVDHLTRIAARSGEVERWPWVELSLVPNPANPEALLHAVRSADAVAHLRIVGADDVAARFEASDVTDLRGQAVEPVEGHGVMAERGTRSSDLIAILDAAVALHDAHMNGSEPTTPESQGRLGGLLAAARLAAAAVPDEPEEPMALHGPEDTSIHNATSDLGPSGGEAAGRSADPVPAPVLAIRAGNDVVPVSDAELSRIADLLAGAATARAREVLRMS